VIVMVEPDSSSRVVVPVRAASAGRATSAGAVPQIERFDVAHHRHQQPGRCLRRDADMDACMLVNDPASSSNSVLSRG
jgi:hypothetical protein